MKTESIPERDDYISRYDIYDLDEQEAVHPKKPERNFKKELNMAYIYCITNIINGKQYVGKTMYSITRRFQEHCSDYLKDRCQNRPLYQAMKKYGVSNFIVHQLWQCDPEEASSYEKIFIDKLETYGDKGYNATKGGDGKLLFDYKKIISLYKEGHSIGEVARKIQCCYDTVFKVIHLYNIP